ncbi:sensor histidine kinase [Deinococcus taklimakanensis]|uniref:histidine kinase n=1 Tax=Deinococcus taklimakanensis TaxID=536443 RepID=A0ABW5P2D6_9DEIO
MTPGGPVPRPRRRMWAQVQRAWLSLPRHVLRREAGLLLFPAALSVLLLVLASQPASRTLSASVGNWRPYPYQALVQDVQSDLSVRLDPASSAQERQDAHDRALSRVTFPGQFPELAAVEAYGDARLSRVRQALEEDTLAGHRRAVEEALHLNAQALTYTHDLNTRARDTIADLRWAVLLGSLVTAALGMLMTFRALLLWRTERERRARREARQREALSLANHELRRPLQALVLISDLLRHTPEDAKRTELLDLLDDQVAQLAYRSDLTRLNDLYLDVTLRVAPTDLTQLLQRLYEPRVALHLPDAPLVWLVDQDRVRQVLENLVENALRYTTGPVEVTLSMVEGAPEFTVRDHGLGLREELHERIFLPYERGPRGLSDGHGLGLPLVRRYARAHGGDVTLHNAPDGGLIVTVRLGEPSTLLTEPARTAAVSG